MEKNIEELIYSFINEVKSVFPEISIRVTRNPYDSSYLIVHNNDNFEEDCFLKLRLDLLEKYFYQNDIYNIGFSYGYQFSEEIASERISGAMNREYQAYLEEQALNRMAISKKRASINGNDSIDIYKSEINADYNALEAA